jgi:hypothetical protein
MPLIILKIRARVNPRIWKGSNRIQKKINRMKIPTASGQHKENRIRKSKTAMMNFM